MRKLVYYVAVSLDGFICGPDADISGFVGEGNGVQQYLNDLAAYDTVIMGRKTYEFGYRFGLQPGKPAYPHMRHYIFSGSLRFDQADEQVKVVPMDIDIVRQLKAESGTDIYLCGGGQLAGWLLDHQLIDVLKIKLNPLVQGAGTRLFGESSATIKTSLTDSRLYDHGLQIMTYDLVYDT